MLTRISRTAVTACCLLTAIGLLALPALAWISTFLALLIGSLAAIRAHSTHPDIPDAARTGITAAAVTAAAGLVAAGVIALLGPVAASVIPLLFGAAGAWPGITDRVGAENRVTVPDQRVHGRPTAPSSSRGSPA
jgi:hypothetical protein